MFKKLTGSLVLAKVSISFLFTIALILITVNNPTLSILTLAKYIKKDLQKIIRLYIKLF